MEKEQAIQILKASIDLAIQKGTYNSLEQINAIGQALQTIINELKK
jgi:hypothetical protein